MRASLVAIALVGFVASYALLVAPASAQIIAAETPIDINCLNPATSRDDDADFNRVSTTDLAATCFTTVSVVDQGLTWRIQRFYSRRPGPLWVVPHDDEDAAFISGIAALQRHGGMMVAIDNRGRRDQKVDPASDRTIDPNRIFGRRTGCVRTAPSATPYSMAMLRYRFPNYPIIALHSNGEGHDGNDGQGDVSIELRGKHTVPYEAPGVYRNIRTPADTMIYMAGSEPRPDAAMTRLIERLHGADINVKYEHVASDWNDCSLSNFALLGGLGPYFNVEVVDNDHATQWFLIDDLIRLAGIGD